MAEQGPPLGRAFGRLAEGARQAGQDHVLHQRRLAAARHAGQADEAAERNLDVDVLQIVGRRALDHEPGRTGRDRPWRGGRDGPPARQIVTGQGPGAGDLAGRAVIDDLAAALARRRAHVDDPVGRMHDLGIVLDDDQRVTGVAQPLHHGDDAGHVLGMQADGGLVQHEQGVDQRSAQGRRQVDPLDLAAGQGPRLAIEGQVLEADLAEIAEAGAQLGQQQVGRLVDRGRQVQPGEQRLEPLDRQQHHVMDRQAGQGVELLARPVDPFGQEALAVGAQGPAGIGSITDAPQQRLGLEARAAAGRAGRVRAVLGEQHPDVHLVGLALQPVEEASDAIPLAPPVAGPVVAAFDDPAAIALG